MLLSVKIAHENNVNPRGTIIMRKLLNDEFKCFETIYISTKKNQISDNFLSCKELDVKEQSIIDMISHLWLPFSLYQ